MLGERIGFPCSDFQPLCRYVICFTLGETGDRLGVRDELNERGAWANVRAMPHRLDPPAFSPFLYRLRNAVERFFSRIKHFRAIATRYDRRDDNDLAAVKLAAIRIWIRHNEIGVLAGAPRGEPSTSSSARRAPPPPSSATPTAVLQKEAAVGGGGSRKASKSRAAGLII